MRLSTSLLLSLLFVFAFSPALEAENIVDSDLSSDLVKLETKFFGHSKQSDTVETRIARLEGLIYGESPALGTNAERIKKLLGLLPPEEPKAIIEEPKDNSKPAPSKYAYLDAARHSLNSQEAMQLRSYPHVDDLEYLIVGKASRGEPLDARIAALETSAFGCPTDLADLSQRIDSLDNYVEKKLHKKAYLQPVDVSKNTTVYPGAKGAGQEGLNSSGNGANVQQAQSQARSKQKFATVANTLLAAAGLGGIAMGPGGSGLGTGPCLGPMRFGGVRFGQRPLQAAEPPVDEEDFDISPVAARGAQPAADGGMSAKLHWCEMQVFGRSFANMHLTERLRQLSKELQYGMNKSDLELMDDISGIVKTVELRQKSRPIGSAETRPSN